MRWIEAAFKAGSDRIDDLCLALTEAGAEGLVIEDEADFRRFLEENRQYWDYVDEALARRYAGVSRVKVYTADSAEGRALLARLTAAAGTEPDTVLVDDADWENRWKAYYHPIEVGRRLVVVPKWEPIPQGGRLPLRLDPGLTFGTGSHPTTKMCLEALEDFAGPQKFVLDLGCGSGILGIGALVLGCGYVAGCDVDPKSPKIAAENAALNGIGSTVFHIEAGDVLKDAALRDRLGAGYDIVLANIVADVIIPLAPLAWRFLAPGGVFICSGILDGRQDETAAALEAAGFRLLSHKTDADWHAFAAERKKV